MNKTLLIVEDDIAIRSALEELLTEDGYKVFCAENGKVGLDILTEIQKNEGETPFLILLDLMMPVMNGLVFLQHLRANANWKFIPVVVLTAFSRAKPADASDLLRKPVEITELLKIIKTYYSHANSPRPQMGAAIDVRPKLVSSN